MPLREMWNDLKAHLEHGAQLSQSHVPALEELLGRVEADPLLAAASSLQVPDGTRQMLADLLRAVEADVKQVEQDAARQAASGAQDAAGAPAEASETSGEAAAS